MAKRSAEDKRPNPSAKNRKRSADDAEYIKELETELKDTEAERADAEQKRDDAETKLALAHQRIFDLKEEVRVVVRSLAKETVELERQLIMRAGGDPIEHVGYARSARDDV